VTSGSPISTFSCRATSFKMPSEFKWRGRDGPPVVAPTRHGFGSTLLKAVFPNILLEYAMEGFSCEIDVLLGNAGVSEMEA
jgi:hypothetical protein